MTESVIKTVAGFLNADGGTLAIGIADDGEILCISADLELKKVEAGSYVNALTTIIGNALAGSLDSYQSVWFQLHEDLFTALGIVRRMNDRTDAGG